MASTASNPALLDKKALKRPDAILSNLKKLFGNITEHSRGVAIIAGLLLVVGAGVAFVMTQKGAKSEQSRDALFHARQTYDAEAKAIASLEKPAAPPAKPDPKADSKAKKAEDLPPDPESIAFKKLDVDTKFQGSVQAFEKVAQDFPRTRAAFEAYLAIGDLHFNHGDVSKALPYYEKALSAAPGKPENALALYSVGYSQEGMGKTAEAIATFEKALALGDAGLKGDLLLSIARCYEKANDTAKARSTYDQIIAQLPNTAQAKSAETYKALLD